VHKSIMGGEDVGVEREICLELKLQGGEKGGAGDERERESMRGDE
jgi:hypothetical protein